MSGECVEHTLGTIHDIYVTSLRACLQNYKLTSVIMCGDRGKGWLQVTRGVKIVITRQYIKEIPIIMLFDTHGDQQKSAFQLSLLAWFLMNKTMLCAVYGFSTIFQKPVFRYAAGEPFLGIGMKFPAKTCCLISAEHLREMFRLSRFGALSFFPHPTILFSAHSSFLSRNVQNPFARFHLKFSRFVFQLVFPFKHHRSTLFASIFKSSS